MARTADQLTASEEVMVWEINWIANNSVLYKDNTWVYTAVALWANGTVLTSAGGTSAPTFQAAGGSGTVTSVTSANADATVATTTTTPVITIVSAPKLTTARTIGGTSFDGTANIAITTNANLTGVVTSTGNATAIADAALSIAKTSGLQTILMLKHLLPPQHLQER